MSGHDLRSGDVPVEPSGTPVQAGHSAGESAAGPDRRRRPERTRRFSSRARLIVVGLAVALILAIAGVLLVVGNRSSTPAAADVSIGAPVSAQVLGEVTGVDPLVIAAVGTGGLTAPLQAIPNGNASSGGKPELLYVGSESCPWCAAERWSLVNALSRFGTFSNLHYTRSADDDGDIATFSFHGAHYTSQYIEFVPVEASDRYGKQLETLTGQQQSILTAYTGGSVPLVYLGGRFWGSGGYDFSVLSGKDQVQIAAALKDPTSPITRNMIGNANYLTAALCTLTFSQPVSACGNTTILNLSRQLAHSA